MDTFVLAARLATDRVRMMMGEGWELPLTSSPNRTPPRRTARRDAALETRESSAPGAPIRTLRRTFRSLVRRRANDVATAEECRFPRPEVLTAGHVWPPVKGRAVVAAAASGALTVPRTPSTGRHPPHRGRD